MALVAGSVALIDDGHAVLSAWHYGRTDGFRLVEHDHFTGIAVPEFLPSVEGDVQDGGAAGAPHSTGSLVAGEVATPDFPGQDWFEKIHIFPNDASDNPLRAENSPIDYGNILAQVDRSYEIYNAFRKTDVVLAAITNNVEPGVELVGLSVPLDLPAQSSLLDASSTANTDGVTGLGVLVRTLARATLDGLPNFDDTVVFELIPGNAVVLSLSGSRISLVTAEFESPLREYMRFRTDVLDYAPSGKEQRIALRERPREAWDVTYRLSGEERQRMQALLLDWEASSFGVPLWHFGVKLTAAVSAAAASLPVTGADDADFRVGGLAGLVANGRQFDVAEILAVTDTQIDSASGTQYGYPEGTLVCPVRTARVTSQTTIARFLVAVEDFSLRFECVDNDTGAPDGDVSWNGNAYNGRPLLDDVNVVTGQAMRAGNNRRIIVIDNETGKVFQTSTWDRSKRTSIRGFFASTRAQVQSLKRLLRYMRGQQRSFYLPTKIEDLTVVDTIGSGTDTVDVLNVGYTRYVRNRDPKRAFRITFTDGTSLERSITASEVVSDDVERLTLNANWPADRDADEVERVEFYELVRFATDEFTLDYDRDGAAKLYAPVVVCFDDDQRTMTTFDVMESGIETSRPIELFRFALGTDSYNYASCEDEITVNGETYTPIAIGRDRITLGVEERKRVVQVTMPGSLSFPQRYVRTPPGRKATLSITKLQRGELPAFATQQLIYKGNVKSVQFEDHGITAKVAVQTREAGLSGTIPRYTFMGPCGHMLYGPGCDVDPAGFSFFGTVSDVDGNDITLDGAGSSGFDFKGGYCRPTGEEDFRLVIAQAGDVLTLLVPFEVSALNATVQAFAGCDHQLLGDCSFVFDNVPKYGGWAFVPTRNVFANGLIV